MFVPARRFATVAVAPLHCLSWKMMTRILSAATDASCCSFRKNVPWAYMFVIVHFRPILELSPTL